MLTLEQLAAIPAEISLEHAAVLLAAYPTTDIPDALLAKCPYFDQIKGVAPLTKKVMTNLDSYALVVLANHWCLNLDTVLAHHATELNTRLSNPAYQTWFSALLENGCIHYSVKVPNYFYIRKLLDEHHDVMPTLDFASYKRSWFQKPELKGLTLPVVKHPGNVAALKKSIAEYIDIPEFMGQLANTTFEDIKNYIYQHVQTNAACQTALAAQRLSEKGLIKGFRDFLDVLVCNGEVPWSVYVQISEPLHTSNEIISRGNLQNNFARQAFTAALSANDADAVAAFKATPFHPLCADEFEAAWWSGQQSLDLQQPCYIAHQLLRMLREGCSSRLSASDPDACTTWFLAEAKKTWQLPEDKTSELRNLLDFVGLDKTAFNTLLTRYSANSAYTYFEQLTKVVHLVFTTAPKPEAIPTLQIGL